MLAACIKVGAVVRERRGRTRDVRRRIEQESPTKSPCRLVSAAGGPGKGHLGHALQWCGYGEAPALKLH